LSWWRDRLSRSSLPSDILAGTDSRD